MKASRLAPHHRRRRRRSGQWSPVPPWHNNGEVVIRTWDLVMSTPTRGGGGGDGDNTMGEFVMDGSVQASSGKQPSVPLVAFQRLYPDGKNRIVGSNLSLSHTNSIYPQTQNYYYHTLNHPFS